MLVWIWVPSCALMHRWAGVPLGLTVCLQAHKCHQTQHLIARVSRWERQAPVGCLSPPPALSFHFQVSQEVSAAIRQDLP